MDNVFKGFYIAIGIAIIVLLWLNLNKSDSKIGRYQFLGQGGIGDTKTGAIYIMEDNGYIKHYGGKETSVSTLPE